jgi:TonB family protein
MHARLAAMADRCYPPAARRFQQRGTVQLSFCTDATGATASRTVTQSSGAELLHAAAQGCVVDSAAPFPREAASRCFSVPVRFGARQ